MITDDEESRPVLEVLDALDEAFAGAKLRKLPDGGYERVVKIKLPGEIKVISCEFEFSV